MIQIVQYLKKVSKCQEKRKREKEIYNVREFSFKIS